jgi:hypothetical protein
MTEPAESPALKALRYAEDVIGVHSVLAEAHASREKLDGILTELGEARDSKRITERSIEDRQFEIMSHELATHSSMSAAAMDKHLKLAYHGDPTLQQLRAQHVAAVNDLDGLELDRAMAETDIKIAVARLHELGGYFEYLAAIKNQAASSS